MSNLPNQLIRLTDPLYADGISALVDHADPVAISRIVFDQDGPMPNAAGLTELHVTWGQFIDHDLSHSTDNSGELVNVEGLVGPLNRSIFDESSGVREQLNTITPAIDASMVYGSTEDRTDILRSFEGGRLIVDENGLMPLAPAGTMAGSTAEAPLFLAGDVRANENTGLTTLHTLFVREHNYWAERLAEARPHWSDTRIFETARSIVEFEIQKITYEDWLPALIGGATPEPAPYDPLVDLSITNEFSTAAFRFGHTMVSNEILRLEEDGSTAPGGHLSVREVFFNNAPIVEHGLADLFRGAAASIAQENDTQMVDDLNLFLESPAGVAGFSLAALNILRGRDHGLDTYISIRAQLLGDIDPATADAGDFSLITSDPETATRLAEAYGSVHNVDLWVGGLAEDKLPGTQLGPLFTHIVAEQFERTMLGDDAFLDLPRGIPRALKQEIKASDLGDIILRNTQVESLQDDVFVFAPRGAGEASESVETPIAKAEPDAIAADAVPETAPDLLPADTDTLEFA